MASSLGYVGISYPADYSDGGIWDVDITVRFTHTSPTDGFYSYKIRYWYWDETQNGSFSGDFNSSCPNATTGNFFLSEAAGQHSGLKSHDYTFSLGWKAGHTYKLGFEVRYNVASWGTTSYEASALGAVNQTITVKAANDGGSGGGGTSGISNVRKSVSETSVTITWDYTPDFSTTDYYEGYVTLGSSYNNPTGSGAKWSSMTQGNNGTITFAVQFSGLTSNTYYAFKIEMYRGASAQSVSDAGEGYVGNFTTSSSGGGDEPSDRFYLWSWSKASGYWNDSEGNATYSMLQSAYNSISNHGETTDFNHTVWNDMVDCVDMGMSDAGFQNNLEDCFMSSSDTVLTAYRFNTLVNHVNALADWIGTSRVNAELSAVSRGDVVYGWYFTELMSKYNDAIDATFPS